MDKLNIDFKSLFPYIIEAFSGVYGEEYRSLISKKINNAIIVYYYNITGLDSYISFFKKCKAREFSIRFLDEIGIDVQKYKTNNYTLPLSEDIRKILACFIDEDCGFSKDFNYFSPLKAFDDNNKTYLKLLENKLKIINYLLGPEHEVITDENFADFEKTTEYLELLKKINEYKAVYERLLSQYNNWANQLEPFERFVKDEQERKGKILREKTIELLKAIYNLLPISVQDFIANKPDDKQAETIFGIFDVSVKTIIEYFNRETMEKLNSSEIELQDKFWIIYWQSTYLKNLGIDIPNEVLICNSEENVVNYLSFLNQENVRKFIPAEEFIKAISIIREKKYEEGLREYFTTRSDFKEAMKKFDNNSDNINYVYSRIKNHDVCIAGEGGINGDNEFISIMFYTIREFDGGALLYSFMHECGHIIDQNQNGCGFEPAPDFSNNSIKNPYNKAFRKYERFNETLNDIFTGEAIKLLQSKGIYLLEPEEYTALDNSNFNTSSLIKDLLQPLIQKFRKQVVKAKINSDPKELIEYIGEDNFEALVDVVNKVDFLYRNGLTSKITKSPEDSMIKEYFEQIKKAEQIYINIDNYYSNKFGRLSPIEEEIIPKM